MKLQGLERTPHSATTRRGFTLIELLVVISIIAVLMSLILPAVQNAREAARRTQCLNNIKNVSLALMNSASSNSQGHLPALSYYPESNAPSAGLPRFFEGRSWVVDILPFLDQQSIYDRWDKGLSWDNASNASLANGISIEALSCPNDDSAFQQPGGLSYVGNAGFGTDMAAAVESSQARGHNFFDAQLDWDSDSMFLGDDDDRAITFQTGVFWPHFQNSFFGPICKGKCTSPGKIYDGTSNTIMLSENTNAGITNWANPSFLSCGFFLPLTGGAAAPGDTTRASNVALSSISDAVSMTPVPTINASKSGPDGNRPFPTSNHPGVVVASFCDGSSRILSEDVDISVYAQLMTPGATRMRTLGSGAAFVPEDPLSSDTY